MILTAFPTKVSLVVTRMRAIEVIPQPRLFHLTVFTLIIVAQCAQADWPTYRHDAARSGYTAEALPTQLSLTWCLQNAQPPQPAWPRSPRLTYDRVFQPVVAGDVVCFGSSVDGCVYGLEATSGNLRWRFQTDGPVRFAPAFYGGCIYAVSDDGHLYCLEAATGDLRWKKRGGPNDELILGNDRMISRWPARGGPVVFDGQIYFTAGIWPSDGVLVAALDTATGRPRWVNDSAGGIYMGQPHPGAFAHSGVSPQGYLAASADRLFVPNGRAVPAAFRRSDGHFEYFHLQQNGQRGGGATVVSDAFYIHDGLVFEQATGEVVRRIERACTVALPEGILQADSTNLVIYRWADRERVDRKGKAEQVRDLQVIHQFPHDTDTPKEVIVAGNEAIIGSENQVSRIDLGTTGRVWTASLVGSAYGLAISQGRLYASTDQGFLYCFAGGARPARNTGPPQVTEPQKIPELVRKTAAEIIRRTGITKGYCLDLGSGDGALTLELARTTALHIIAIDPDATNVAKLRELLSAEGYLGSRVTVLQRDATKTGLPPYFANLVVSGRSLSGRQSSFRPRTRAGGEGFRLQRPWGGVLCVGPVGSMEVQKRGALERTGNWTHQYADAANTLCSTDESVHGPLGVLWFNDVDQRLVQRHGRPPAPLFQDGLIYSEGRDSLVAMDAYNGLKVWEYELPGILQAYDGDHLMGTSGSGSNFALSEDSVFVRRDNYCLRLDAKTGKLLGKLTAPPDLDGRPGKWGFLAYFGGLVFGSLANPDHVVTFRYLKGGDLAGQLTESRTLFALDPVTGNLKWRYDAKNSIRHNSISIGAGAVVLIDRPLALYDRVRNQKPSGDNPGELLALEATTGRELWRNYDDIYGTVTALSEKHRRIVMSYQPTRFALASELGGRLACFDLKTGARRWEQNAKYLSRPILNDRTVYAEGGAWDLVTGNTRPFPLTRSYGCGILSASRNLVVFRSATLGYFDLDRNSETEEFGGMRPGCWVNVLPVGGLVLAPDATAGCACSYPNQGWVALRPDGVRPPAMQPPGIASRTPITVTLGVDQPPHEHIRYTVDGSVPDEQSARYVEPLKLTGSTLLQARSFGSDSRVSRVVSARFLIDPAILSLAAEDWRIFDAPGAEPASDWKVMQGEIIQSANTFRNTAAAMGKAPGVERAGTFHIYEPGQSFRNGELSFEIQSADNDTIGVAFRFTGPEKYYLWCMDRERGFRTLARKEGQHYTLLATRTAGYQTGKWYAVRITADGSRFTVHVDGEKDLEAEDVRYPAGTVALYSWGNSGTTFRNVMFKPM